MLLVEQSISRNTDTSKRKTGKRFAELFHSHFHFRSNTLHNNPLHAIHNLFHQFEEEWAKLFRKMHYSPIFAMLQHLIRSLYISA